MDLRRSKGMLGDGSRLLKHLIAAGFSFPPGPAEARCPRWVLAAAKHLSRKGIYPAQPWPRRHAGQNGKYFPFPPKNDLARK